MNRSTQTLLDSLNPQQREAVLFNDAPQLIVAGAGSGKTRVLMVKAVYYCEELNISPESILCITFTNKAAEEMKSRLAPYSPSINVGTFHATCLKIVTVHGHYIDIKKPVTIYDQQDQIALVKDCIDELGLDKKQVNAATTNESISRKKDELESPDNPAPDDSDEFCDIYRLYEQKLSCQNALDFGDLIFKTVTLLKNYPDLCRHYRQKYTHLLVDEYQDTNTAQAVLLELLAGPDSTICVVGDPDQSIYGWRGANIHNILEFDKRFPNAQLFKLERNYRSTDIILNATNSLIQYNTNRPEKTLWTDKTGTKNIMHFTFFSARQEAKKIAQMIADHNIAGIPYSEIAVFYRTKNLSRMVEELFIERGIPYCIVGGLPLYQHKEIKDIIAYLRILSNPDSIVSWKRIINVPTRGIGQKSIEKISAHAITASGTFYDALQQHNDIPRLTKQAHAAIDFLTGLIEHYRSTMNDRIRWSDMLATLIEEIGYRSYIDETDLPEQARTRNDNIDLFINALSEYQDDHKDASLDDFLSTITLRTDIDDWDNALNRVSLMSLHCAKGLEFEIVFLIGLEEGLLPYIKDTETPDEIEEERRLCYVGMTRAKQQLYIFTCPGRLRFTRSVHPRPSRFINELPENIIIKKAPIEHGSYIKEVEACDERFNTFINEFGPGDNVYHYDLGKGKILGGTGSGKKKKLIVLFDGESQPRIVMASYAGLTKLEDFD